MVRQMHLTRFLVPPGGCSPVLQFNEIKRLWFVKYMLNAVCVCCMYVRE